ncbi:MAG TPA: GIY-YIG nuclease family protein [Nitrosomonas europaea]|uniref:GIY-YIG nuclease family protein n=1 Tax=Nitrosomonas europaea TaxID=915 RepID=UPI002490E40C|nr:GIY-YIG nuclease family protein [Nitrosomonas europaea]HRN82966.1 GIY-YIG nuclease family protein [Nitrosomonas europaea]HRO57482.1 GIY-YIG nuclease family protein [Nitrosomonas europaea]HRQ09346.1 GIY-YIG nuclease family protein [Nitrosomonas europaea]HUM75084.1 GIY-YIG nuclease family protein [Nitrosomonas europaea]
MSNSDLDDLAAELAEFAPPEKKKGRSASEERVIAGFEEIQRFTEQHGRAPQHGEGRDIFERLYAVRLDRLRVLPDCRALLEPLDHQGLLAGALVASGSKDGVIDIDDLAAELADVAGSNDITVLHHVRSAAEKRAAEEIANREPCADFDRFRPLFEQVHHDLKTGTRQARRFMQDARVETGDFFILGGQTVYVAEKGNEFTTPQGHPDARLRVVYSNSTESNLLMRSLQRALNKDEAGRRITGKETGSLFGGFLEEDDIESGTIYVLRSLSNHPFIAEHRELIHKIGVTGGKVETRIAGATHDATYLLADVEIVATWKLAGINRTRLEALFHRIFAPAQLDLTIQDRFGCPIRPREWFLVPLSIIDEVVKRILDGSISDVIYDPKTANLQKI